MLAASSDRQNGERLLREHKGVYVHQGKTAHKAGSYVRYTPVCRDGILWSAKWEVRADRSGRIVVHNTDQWIQPERSARL
eukprot:7877278-Alexandrium_andersonii.AAC.1